MEVANENKKKFEVANEDKKKIEASLSDLCFKLKAVSQRNVSLQENRTQRGFSEGPIGFSGLNGSGFSGFNGPRHPLRKATSCDDAHRALEDTCSR